MNASWRCTAASKSGWSVFGCPVFGHSTTCQAPHWGQNKLQPAGTRGTQPPETTVLTLKVGSTPFAHICPVFGLSTQLLEGWGSYLFGSPTYPQLTEQKHHHSSINIHHTIKYRLFRICHDGGWRNLDWMTLNQLFQWFYHIHPFPTSQGWEWCPRGSSLGTSFEFLFYRKRIRSPRRGKACPHLQRPGWQSQECKPGLLAPDTVFSTHSAAFPSFSLSLNIPS